MAQGSDDGSDRQKKGIFQKLICNLLLNEHPICTAKWSHPMCTKSIHQYYLNYYTVCLEYKGINDTICVEHGMNSYNGCLLENINQALICAASNGNAIIVKWCLKNKVNIHIYADYTLQWTTIKKNNLKIVKILFDAGIDIHHNNDYALRYSAENGYLDIVTFLLDNGANVHANYDQALIWAADRGHLDIVQLLLDRGADIHVLNDYEVKWTKYYAHRDILKLLKKYKK